MDSSADEYAPILLRQYRGHHGEITSLAYNPISDKLASSSTDKTVNLWNTNDRLRCFKFTGHSDAVNCVAWSHNGELMATAGKDNSIKLWVPTVRGSSSHLIALCNVRSVDFHPKGRRLVTGCEDKSVKLWSIEHKKFLSSFLSHTNRVRCARFSMNGKLVASCADDRTTKIFDLNSGDVVHSYAERTIGHGLDVAWHPDNNYIAVGMSSNRVKIFDTRNHQLIQMYSCFKGAVNSIAFHPHGQILLTASDDGSTKLIDLIEGRPIYTLLGHDDAVTAVAFTADGQNFASGGRDKTIMFWKLNIDNHSTTMSSKENSQTFHEQEDVGNLLDNSIMVDPRKASNFKYPLDDFEEDGVELLHI